MAVTGNANTIVVTGTSQVVTGPVDIVAVQNHATTSFAIQKNSTTVLDGGTGTGQVVNVDIRSASGFTVNVVGGGSITLFLRLSSHR